MNVGATTPSRILPASQFARKTLLTIIKRRHIRGKLIQQNLIITGFEVVLQRKIQVSSGDTLRRPTNVSVDRPTQPTMMRRIHRRILVRRK